MRTDTGALEPVCAVEKKYRREVQKRRETHRQAKSVCTRLSLAYAEK